MLEDEEIVLRTIGRHLRETAHVVGASTVDGALFHLDRREDWAGFLVDLGIGDQPLGGLDVLREARRRFPTRPAAIVTGSDDETLAALAADLGVVLLRKPASGVALRAFARRALRESVCEIERDELAAALERTPLSAREREVVIARYEGRSTAEVAAELGIAPKTVEAHVTHLLRKVRAPSVMALVERLLRQS